MKKCPKFIALLKVKQKFLKSNKNNKYSVNLYELDLSKDIPYEKLIAKEFFEKP